MFNRRVKSPFNRSQCKQKGFFSPLIYTSTNYLFAWSFDSSEIENYGLVQNIVQSTMRKR